VEAARRQELFGCGEDLISSKAALGRVAAHGGTKQYGRTV
jgi:hypothetical protein